MLKLIRFFAFALVCVLLLSALPALADATAESPSLTASPAPTEAPWPEKYDPGLSRAPSSSAGYRQTSDLAKKMNVDLKNSIPLYTPTDPQPLNAYMVTHPNCDVGINGDDMYKVSKKGLVNSITKYLNEWMSEITEESKGAIRFVSDPNQADILVSACQTYSFYGTYSSGTRRSSGYSCTVKLDAYLLSDTSKHVSLSSTNNPGKTERTSGGSKFWKYPPELKGTSKLTTFVDTILGWYGYKVGVSKSGVNVKAVRQALQDRAFMAKGSKAGTTYDDKAKKAVQLLQKTYGLKETGKIDKTTLIALYYDRDTVKRIVNSYPQN